MSGQRKKAMMYTCLALFLHYYTDQDSYLRVIGSTVKMYPPILINLNQGNNQRIHLTYNTVNSTSCQSDNSITP